MNMSMKTNNRKMVTGFMCHSPAATAVCMTKDHRSVIVPRRPDGTLVDHARLINTAKYTRITERRRYLASSATKRSSTTNVIPSPKTTTTTNDQVQIKKEHKCSQLPPPEHVVQEVVMRVSLHCQGCAGKVKKLLSKMEGVTSFTVDLETKRVTVMGHVSPLGVLESISKVKKAEFWSC